MGLGEDIKRLKGFDGLTHVLSVYLSTAPDKRNQWETILRNEKKRLLTEQEDKQAVEAVFSKIEQAINNQRTSLLRSIVAFVSSDDSLQEVYFLQLDVTDGISYYTKPNLNQLEVLDQQFPRTGIVLTHLDSATVLDVRLGEVEATHDYELDSIPDSGGVIRDEADEVALRAAIRRMISAIGSKSRQNGFTASCRERSKN